MNNLDLLSRIDCKKSTFSKGQKRIAAFLSEHYDKAVYLTAAKLGEVVGVSESTVVRFATELGFDGYPMFQRALEELVKTRLTFSQRMDLSANRLQRDNKHILHTVLRSDAERIVSAMEETDTSVFDQALEAILTASRVYIVGGRSSALLANFLTFNLNLMLDNVINVSGTTEIIDQIFRIKEGDVFVGISFPRYSNRTVKAMEYAKSKNAVTIAITDSILSPIANYADHNLIARSDMLSFVDSLVAPLSVINAMLASISIRKKDELNHTFDKLEAIWGESHVYSSAPFEGKKL